MSTATHVLPSRVSAPPSGALRPSFAVFLPKEHGSWSLVLEPLALGLMVAPSSAGGALATAALAGFFARRPLKASVDSVASPRRLASRRALGLLVVLALVGVAEAVVLAPWAAFWPLLPASALGAFFVWFDAQGESRAASAEVAGSAAFAFVPAALAALAGQSVGMALVLAALALARSIPAVLAVRSFLRIAKGGVPGRSLPLLASLVAAGVLAALASSGLAPLAAAGFGALFLARTLWLLGPWRPAWPARRIGMMEAILGLAYVVVLAAAWSAAVAIP